MDIYHDINKSTWYEIGTKYRNLIPSYVLNFDLQEKVAAYEPEEYADPINKLFPINNKANVWLSAAYFTKNANQLKYKKFIKDYIEDSIKSAAEFFGISEDVNKIVEAIKHDNNDVKNDTYFGYVEKTADGKTVSKKYPLNDAKSVKKAAEYFLENVGKYPADMRKIIASAILKKANEFGVEIPDNIEKYARIGVPKRDLISSELMDRVSRIDDIDLAEKVASIVEQVCTGGDIVPYLDKIAETVSDIDIITGLNKQYNKKVLPPEEFIYSISLKEAEDLERDSVKLVNYIFSVKELAKLPIEVFSNVLGENFVDRIVDNEGKIVEEKLADELYSLPLPDKQALEEYLQQLFS